MRIAAVMFFVGALIFSGVVETQVFKCTDRTGEVSYQQVPCSSGQDETRPQIHKPPPVPFAQAESEKVTRSNPDGQTDTLRVVSIYEDNRLQVQRVAECNRRYDKIISDMRGKNPIGGMDMAQRHALEIAADRAACIGGDSEHFERKARVSILTDQFGNTYTQKGESRDIINNRTGRPCRLVGEAVIQC